MGKPICPYCEREAELVNSKDILKSDYGMLWICRPCDAYTTVHANSKKFKPRGILANKRLRFMRVEAHKKFDPVWKEGGLSRKDAYRWLALKLEIPENDCHIGMFDEDKCNKVMEVCKTG